MEIISTHIPGLLIVKTAVFGDSRGYFTETYNRSVFEKSGLVTHFVQDNESMSNAGVVRGLHYQLEPSR